VQRIARVPSKTKPGRRQVGWRRYQRGEYRLSPKSSDKDRSAADSAILSAWRGSSATKERTLSEIKPALLLGVLGKR